MKMIYCFCNQQYGLQLMQTAVAYARANNVALSIVFSDKWYLPKRPAKRQVSSAWRIFRRFVRERRLGLRYGAPVILAGNVNSKNFRKHIAAGSHGVIAGFNQIFRKETIARFETFVNCHPALLPLYRGPVPSYWCIHNGERATGYTLHEVTENIDEGKILFQEVVEIEEGIDEAVLDQKIATAACPTLKKYLEHIQEQTQWEQKTVDAYKVYGNHVSYASFPNDRKLCLESRTLLPVTCSSKG